MVRINQINCRKCEQATLTVGSIPDSIYLMQEIYYTAKGNAGVRVKSHLYGKPQSRAAIYLSSLQSCSFVPMPQFTDDDISTVIIEGGSLKEPTIISSVYLDLLKNNPVVLPKLRYPVEFASMNGKRLICGLDSNAHSSLWGSDDVNERGLALEDFIFEFDMMVQNVGIQKTWQARGLSSIIDITLTLNIGDEILDWHVSDRKTFSDHKIVCFSIGKPTYTKKLARNFNRADWNKFQDYIKTNLDSPPELWSNEIIEKSCDHFNKILEKAIDLACPTHPVRKRDKIHFWNQECENAKRHYLSLSKKCRSKGMPDGSLNSVKTALIVDVRAIPRPLFAFGPPMAVGKSGLGFWIGQSIAEI